MTSNSSRPDTRHLQRKYDQTPANLVEKPISLVHWLLRGVWLVTTLGLGRVFYKTWRFVPMAATGGLEGLPISVNTNDRPAKWKAVVGKLKKEWKQICLGCALTVTLSVALLQIDLVLQTSIGRTTAIITFILSGAGLMLSTTFRLVIHRSKKRKYPSQWIEASETFNNLKSTKFWSLLALPLSFLAWSVIFCIITVLTLPWTVQNAGAVPDGDNSLTKPINIISVAVLLTITLMIIRLAYRAIKFAKELC